MLLAAFGFVSIWAVPLLEDSDLSNVPVDTEELLLRVVGVVLMWTWIDVCSEIFDE